MTSGIFYNKRTGEPVQIIARAQTKPTFQEVICYQELTVPYEHYVMEKRQFFAEYVKDFEELPLKSQKQIEKREDLPDKRPLISKGVVETPGEDEASEKQEESGSESKKKEMTAGEKKIKKMMDFFDAGTFWEKIRLLENMRDDLDEHMLNNIAVSLDLSLEDGVDGYEFILSELKIRDKYEGDRGERL